MFWRYCSHVLGLAAFFCAAAAAIAPQTAYALRFVVYGDSRGCSLAALINETILGQINQRIGALHPEPEFAVFLGDFSYRGDIPAHGAPHYTYQAWLDFMRSTLPGSLPLYLAAGNHEMYNESLGENVLAFNCQVAYQAFVASNASSNFMQPITSLSGYEDLAYSFSSHDGKSLFVVLDGFYVPATPSTPEVGGKLNQTQLNYLSNILSSSNAVSKFVFIHNPAFLPTNQNYTNCAQSSMCEFWRIIDDNRAKAVFAGHSHLFSRVVVDPDFLTPNYQWRNAIPQVIAGSAGAPVDGVTPNCASDGDIVYAPSTWNVKMLYNYSVVDVSNAETDASLTITSYCSGGDGNWTQCDYYASPSQVPAFNPLSF